MGDVLTLVILALPLAGIWFLLVRPAQRRAREAQALSDTLQVGQEVMTTSGLYGTLVGLDDDVAVLNVAEGVRVRFARKAIAAVLPLGGASDTNSPD